MFLHAFFLSSKTLFHQCPFLHPRNYCRLILSNFIFSPCSSSTLGCMSFTAPEFMQRVFPIFSSPNASWQCAHKCSNGRNSSIIFLTALEPMWTPLLAKSIFVPRGG